MPRPKRHANHQHNARHENGIVAPGKRIVKQKSNGQLNGGPPGGSRADDTTPPAASPAQATASGFPAPASVRTNGTILRRTSSQTSKQEPRASPTEVITSDVERVECSEASAKAGEHRRKTEVEISTNGHAVASKPGPAPPALAHGPLETGSLHLALTVLRSCPLRDTLAILIFLLSLPPTLLSITNGVFAVLTFVPPTGSFASLPTLADIMSSPSPGAPSFLVVMLIDIVAWLLLGFFAPPLQLLLLDYAQAMIATTLGGRTTSSRNGAGADSTMQCVGMVSILHVTRHRALILRTLHRTFLWKWLPEIKSFDHFDFQPSYVVGRSRSPLQTVNVIIALHIVCQGFTRVVRRLLYTSQRSGAGNDPEAVAGSQNASESPDVGHNPPHTPIALRSITSLQSLREGKDKISSEKRRKRQGNHVRSQQPLWAAFAATKATIVREYEQSLATTEAVGSNATDGKHLGDAQFLEQEGRVWVTEILPLNFFFETGPFARPSAGKAWLKNQADSDVVDRTKPLVVRVNEASWASVKMKELPQTEDEKGRPRWIGEVYGLSPSNSYHVTFHGSEDGSATYEEAISTPALPVAAQGENLPCSRTNPSLT